MKKLRWMNGEYIAKRPRETCRQLFTDRLRAAGLPLEPLACSLDDLIPCVQIRTKTLNDIPRNCSFFFTDDIAYDSAAVEKRLRKPGAIETLDAVAKAFEALPEFTEEATEHVIRAMAEEKGGMGALVHPIRVAVSGLSEGPGLFEMLALLGRERVLARIRKAQTL